MKTTLITPVVDGSMKTAERRNYNSYTFEQGTNKILTIIIDVAFLLIVVGFGTFIIMNI